MFSLCGGDNGGIWRVKFMSPILVVVLVLVVLYAWVAPVSTSNRVAMFFPPQSAGRTLWKFFLRRLSRLNMGTASGSLLFKPLFLYFMSSDYPLTISFSPPPLPPFPLSLSPVSQWTLTPFRISSVKLAFVVWGILLTRNSRFSLLSSIPHPTTSMFD